MDSRGLELRRVRERELELKRIAGEISCAECRRLKLRCDKKAPCCSCIRRGFKNICPTGTSTGSSVRQIAINSASNLYSNGIDAARNVAAMGERIRALEDALQIATDASHPLLSAELLAIKRGTHTADTSVEDPQDDNSEETLVGAFGTLSVSEGKAMQFLGASATESVLLMEVFDPTSTPHSLDFSELPPELAQASGMWPFAPACLSRPAQFAQLGTYLPPFERVSMLIEAYFSRYAWFLGRSQIEDELLPLFYPQGEPVAPTLLKAENMHDLALLFIVLAGGILVDNMQSTMNSEAERFQQLARAALGLNSVFEFGSLSACQALLILGSYEVHVGRKASQESSWKLHAMSMSHAASIGLHRDPSHWKFEPEMADRRRRVFWEIYSTDKWKCLGSGRPSLFPAHAVDCHFPLDHAITDDDGTVVESVGQWRYRFSQDVLPRLADKICSAQPHKYSEIMKLDKLVRDFDLHPFVARSLSHDFTFRMDEEHLSLHPLFTVWWKEKALLYVHRNLFARAILEYGNDPMRSPFGPSFLAAYRSATTILKTARAAFDKRGHVLKWLLPFWAMSLSSAIIVGSVASRVAISFSAFALSELEHAILLFEKSSHPVAKHGLSLLNRLRDKAKSATNNTSPASDSQSPSASSRTTDTGTRSASPSIRGELGDEEKELNILRGTTRRIERRSALPDIGLQSISMEPSPFPLTSFSEVSSSDGMSKAANVLASLPGNTQESDAATGYASNIHRFDNMNVDSLPPSSAFVENPLASINLGIARQHPSLASFDVTQPCFGAYEGFRPPVLESATQNPEMARAWLTAVERDRAAAISAQFGGQQQQLSEKSKDAPSSQSEYHHQPEVGSIFSGTSGPRPSAPLDPSIESIPAEYTDDVFPSFDRSKISNAQLFPPFDFMLDPPGATDAFLPQTSSSRPAADLNTLYEEGNAASAEAWRSFMQQFESMDGIDAELENWDAMEFP